MDMRRHSQCDICERMVPRNTLIRQQWTHTQPAGTNLIPYSDYNSSGWTSTASDAGLISLGPFQRNRWTVPSGTTWVLSGEQTWDGTGRITSSAIDCSGLTNVCFSVWLIPYYEDIPTDLTFILGYNDGSDNPMKTIRLDTTMERVYFSTTSIGTAQFYIEATGDDRWAFVGAQVEDSIRPGTYVKTAGAGLTLAQGTRTDLPAVCPGCRARNTNVEKNLP